MICPPCCAAADNGTPHTDCRNTVTDAPCAYGNWCDCQHGARTDRSAG